MPVEILWTRRALPGAATLAAGSPARCHRLAAGCPRDGRRTTGAHRHGRRRVLRRGRPALRPQRHRLLESEHVP